MIVECDTLAQAIEVLQTLEQRIENVPLEKSLKECGAIVEARTIQNFLNAEDPAGNPWPALKYRRPPPPALTLTGNLARHAAQAAANPRISGNELLIDASEPYYGKFHLVGGVRLPKREWLGVTDQHVDQMTGIVCDNIVQWVMTGEQ